MERGELLERLIDLAQDAGFQVRTSPARKGGGDTDPAIESGVCRVRGELWVVLARSDGVEERIAVLVAALGAHAGDLLEQRYLPPAVRAALRGDSAPG